MTPEMCAQTIADIEAEVGRVIVGQRDLVRAVMVCLLCEGHALIEGVPGLGKTELLKALGRSCGTEFARIQFTPDLMPSDVVGTQIIEDQPAGGKAFRFQPGPIFASFVLADEINRASPKTQSALLEAMAERTVTVAGKTRPLPRPFFVMATQNPVEMEGTYPLPEAQLDRFLVKVLVPYPSAIDLAQVVTRTTSGVRPEVSAVTHAPELQAMIGLTRQVPVAAHIVDYAVALVLASQPSSPSAPALVGKYVRFGSSPRGAQALILAAKALALLDGRPNVAIADVRAAAPMALRHRLVVGYEATADGVSADSIVASVLDIVAEPNTGMRGAP